MFANLIESNAKSQKRVAGFTLSAVIHAGLITAAVVATAAAKDALEKPKAEKVAFVQVKKAPPPKEEPPPPELKAPPPKGFQVLTAPIKIPDVLPDIDLSKRITNEDDFSGKGVAGGIAKGIVGATGPVNNDQTFFEFQV